MTPHRRWQWLQAGLLLAGLILVGTWARSAFLAGAYQAAESARLEAERSRPMEVISVAAARAGGRDRGAREHRRGRDVLGRLEIPRLGIEAIVAEGVDGPTLGRAVGHVPSTARPGKSGNCALAGHRDTFLRGLGKIRVNDVVRIATHDRTFFYRVEWTEVVEPRRIDVLDPTPDRCVTLITCYPFNYVGHAPKRFIVRARQVHSIAASAIGNQPD